MNGSTCSSISISTLLSRARVWEKGAALLALLALFACVSRGRLGGSRRTPASSAKWKAVPRCILWSPFFKALEKSRSAFSRLNFTDREHRAMNPFSSCLAAIVGDGKRQAHVFTISGGDIYTRRTNRFY